jgi:hypothetical protein
MRARLREVFPVREERQDLEVWAILSHEWAQEKLDPFKKRRQGGS